MTGTGRYNFLLMLQVIMPTEIQALPLAVGASHSLLSSFSELSPLETRREATAARTALARRARGGADPFALATMRAGTFTVFVAWRATARAALVPAMGRRALVSTLLAP